MRHSLLVVVCLLSASLARAQMGPMPGEDRFKGITGQEQNSAGAGAMYTEINGEKFIQLNVQTAFNLGEVGVGLNVPLNLRLDPAPRGQLRKQDWDENSDYLKVIRYVRFGHKHSDDLLFLRFGELAADLGHGTIMSRYMNNLDLNTFHAGSQVDFYTNYGGIETVVGNYGAFSENTGDSRIVGTRVYFKPLSLWDPDSIFNRIAVGFNVVTDRNAPRSLATEEFDENGDGISDDVDGDGTPDRRLALDNDKYRCSSGSLNCIKGKTSPATVWGLDLEARVLNMDMLKLTPYIDQNFISGGGWGLHMGLLFVFNFPIGFELTIPARLEYRRFREDYIPSYFSTFYELERYTFPLGDSGAKPKRTYVADQPNDKGLNGYYGDLALDFAGLLRLGAIYEGYEGSDPNLAAFLAVPALETIQFKAYYTRTGITGWNDLIVLDERSMLVAEARYELISYTYLVGRFTRRWVLEDNPADKDYGTPVPKDDWKAGIEVAFTF